MVGVEYWGLVFLPGRIDDRDRVGEIRGEGEGVGEWKGKNGWNGMG